MAKITIKASPTFSTKVGIPVAGAPDADVSFTFKHMSRDVFEPWLASLEGKDKVKAFQDCVGGWEFDDEFTPENIQMFLDQYLGAFPAVVQKYMREMSGAKEKN